MSTSLRYLGCAVGFGFGAVWMTKGFGWAIVCLLLAALGYVAVFTAERAQANANTPRPEGADILDDGFPFDYGEDDELPGTELPRDELADHALPHHEVADHEPPHDDTDEPIEEQPAGETLPEEEPRGDAVPDEEPPEDEQAEAEQPEDATSPLAAEADYGWPSWEKSPTGS